MLSLLVTIIVAMARPSDEPPGIAGGRAALRAIESPWAAKMAPAASVTVTASLALHRFTDSNMEKVVKSKPSSVIHGFKAATAALEATASP